MSIVEYFKKKDGMIFKPQKKGIIFSPQPQKFHTARNYLLYDNHLLYSQWQYTSITFVLWTHSKLP